MIYYIIISIFIILAEGFWIYQLRKDENDDIESKEELNKKLKDENFKLEKEIADRQLRIDDLYIKAAEVENEESPTNVDDLLHLINAGRKP